MDVELVIAPEAQRDIEETYAWYEERRSGLGEDFLGSVDACVHTICRIPNSYPQVYKEYHRALVRRFPYAIFYEYIEQGFHLQHFSYIPESEKVAEPLKVNFMAVVHLEIATSKLTASTSCTRKDSSLPQPWNRRLRE